MPIVGWADFSSIVSWRNMIARHWYWMTRNSHSNSQEHRLLLKLSQRDCWIFICDLIGIASIYWLQKFVAWSLSSARRLSNDIRPQSFFLNRPTDQSTFIRSNALMSNTDNRLTSASADDQTMIGGRSTDFLTTASAAEIGNRRSENYNFVD